MARAAVERGVNVSMVLVDVIVVDLCMRVVFRERENTKSGVMSRHQKV